MGHPSLHDINNTYLPYLYSLVLYNRYPIIPVDIFYNQDKSNMVKNITNVLYKNNIIIFLCAYKNWK
jgi:hypothetical protein